MNSLELIYADYVSYCARIGVKPASYGQWAWLTGNNTGRTAEEHKREGKQ